ncbi:MAG: polysaccharide biosynthesis C-terminal domain-containing protein [Butyrivibrio sp.]|uniref:MATE family efflux transporter n=1 Tax=Butyrivibrio sp. TaxID=28121 RepID=UPI0025BDF089|nr:MATE family efflux transporter [Butyrivibrio sp.]MBQ6587514.1 polysaccharide biosynthesis C-terminal domain-containing protein [Butyrivibrio sp.]
MKNIQGISPFSKQMFIRQYVPVLISAFVFALADMADALVVGNRMGATGLGAIAFTLPVYMFYNVIMHSFGLGGAIDFSTKMTEGNEERARSSFQGVLVTLLVISTAIVIIGHIGMNGLLFILGVPTSYPELYEASKTYLGIILTAAPLFFFDYSIGYYLRNDDYEKQSSIAAGIGNIADLLLNIILVLVFNMGVRGAAYATFTGLVLSSAVELFFMLQKTSHLKLTPFKPDFSNIVSIYKLGVASFISYLYSFVFILIGNNAMIRLGGDAGVAVFDIIGNLGNLGFYIFNAAAMATQPIISTYEGECKYDECDRVQTLSFITTAVSAIALAVLLNIFAPQVCQLFGLHDPSMIAFGSTAIRIYSASLLFIGFNVSMSNYYTSRNIPAPPFVTSTLRGVVILLPVTFACIALGKDAFWFTYVVTEAASFVLVYIYLKIKPPKTARIAEERIYHTSLGSDAEKIAPTVEQIEVFCEKWDAAPKQLYYIQMTVEEVCSAIIVNGFQKSGRNASNLIELTVVAQENEDLSLHIRDNATSFNPFGMSKKSLFEIENKDSDFNALGMDIIKKKAKSFYYRRYQGFNTMVVKI